MQRMTADAFRKMQQRQGRTRKPSLKERIAAPDWPAAPPGYTLSFTLYVKPGQDSANAFIGQTHGAEAGKKEAFAKAVLAALPWGDTRRFDTHVVVEATYYCSGRFPDASNLGKGLLDALQTCNVLRDDGQECLLPFVPRCLPIKKARKGQRIPANKSGEYTPRIEVRVISMAGKTIDEVAAYYEEWLRKALQIQYGGNEK